MTEWQDISTAPKDGTIFLAYPNYDKCKWVQGQNLVKDGWNTVPLMIPIEPTHWAPLYAPPLQAKEDG